MSEGLSCLSCLHWRPERCALELAVYPHGSPLRCDGFDYEPGSDEDVLRQERREQAARRHAREAAGHGRGWERKR